MSPRPPRSIGLVLTFSLFVVVSGLNISAQQPKVMAPHKPTFPRAERPLKWPMAAALRSVVGGPWMTDANFKASIYLRSVVETDPITVTPILYLSNGEKYTLPTVKIEPAGVAIIDINEGLRLQGISSWATLSGYVEIQYSWPWDPFCATIRDIDVAHSLIFTYGLQPSISNPRQQQLHLPAAAETHTIEGMWWKQEKNVTGFVALANTALKPVHVNVQVTDDEGKQLAEHTLMVSSHGMKLVALSELESSGAVRGGVRITSAEPTDSLIVNGGVQDQATGYSAILPFAVVHPESSQPAPINVAELGLMAGAANPMMRFPAGTTFTPYSILRNISNAPLSVTPTLWWMEGAAARSLQLSQITLLPGQTRLLDIMASLAGQENFNGNLNIAFNGNVRPGALLWAAGSVDQTNTYVFEVTPYGVAESVSKSLQYWSTGNGDDTMVTVWNPADEGQDYLFKLFFAGGHYALPLHLEPRATRTLNVSEIIENQIPDSEGNIIPPSVHEGSAKITGSQAENDYIMVGIDAGVYNVRKATCGQICEECDGYLPSGSSIVVTPFALAVGHQTSLSGMLTFDSGGQYYVSGAGGTWSSSNTAKATVTSGVVNGVAPGSVSISSNFGNLPEYAGWVCLPGGGQGCPTTYFQASGGGTVMPRIDSITPNWGQVGNNTLAVTISGSSFGTTPLPTVSFGGTGITLVTYGTRNDTTVTATFNIAANAPLGNQDVMVKNNAVNISSNPVSFQVTPTSSCAVPVRFRQTSESNLPDGALHFAYDFDSSTGNTNDLSGCTIGETVFYPTNQNPFPWPLPMVSSTINPDIQHSTGNNHASQDTNHAPSSYKPRPYNYAHFTATQRMWWQCPCYQSGNVQLFVPDIAIDRYIEQTGSTWRYRMTKSGYTNTFALP